MKKLLFQTTFMLLSVVFFLACSKSNSGEFKCGQKVIDADGNVYNTIKIGSQCWFRENLRTSKYNDGTEITTGLNNTQWGSTTSGANTLYDDDDANITPYGRLYNWHAVNTGKLCPEGWSIPSEEQFLELIEFLGGSSVANDKLRSKTLWIDGTNGNNQSGFNAFPAGLRLDTGLFQELGKYTYFWTSTFYDASDAFTFYLTRDGSVGDDVYTKRYGFSCRCIKD